MQMSKVFVQVLLIQLLTLLITNSLYPQIIEEDSSYFKNFENWNSKHSISDIKKYKTIQKNKKYQYEFGSGYLDSVDYYRSYFLVDKQNQVAYQLETTIDEKNLKSLPQIFSPNGEYTALIVWHFDNISILRTENLREFILDNYKPEIVTDIKIEDGPQQIFRVLNWKNNDVLICSGSCCNSSIIYEYNIKNKKAKRIKFINHSK